MKLLIAIPALNEEDSIAAIIERSLAARETIMRHSPVTEVEITVVSDGSTDRTVEIASRYADRIRVVVFPKNRGYGAAIQEAWRTSDAELLGFLDADGTCDPAFFGPLCAALAERDADVALGCRLNAASRMPPLRRLGNLIFATLLSLFCSSRVRDTASGMRVVRRSSLPKLYPLPDGLHFTPAMSARAMLSESVRLIELDMPYHERAGASKLRVLKDGLRFLKVILGAAFLYRPSRPLGLLGAASGLAAWVLMWGPIRHYAAYRSVEEWMIYRFLVSDLLGTASVALFCAGHLMDRIVSIGLAGELGRRRPRLTTRFFASSWFWAAPALLAAFGGALVLGSLLEWLSTGATYEHWSRYVVMLFCLSAAILLAITRGTDLVLDLLEERAQYLRGASEARAAAAGDLAPVGTRA